MCRLQLPSRVPRRVNRINKHRGLPIMLCMNPRRQPWSSSSRNNNDIQNIIIFQLIMHDCTFLKCGVQQTICFKPLAHRSVKFTFSGRLSLTESCGELPGCDIDIGRIRLVKFRPTILGSAHLRTVKMLLTEAGQSNGKFLSTFELMQAIT